jgi:hypothetical protein
MRFCDPSNDLTCREDIVLAEINERLMFVRGSDKHPDEVRGVLKVNEMNLVRIDLDHGVEKHFFAGFT